MEGFKLVSVTVEGDNIYLDLGRGPARIPRQHMPASVMQLPPAARLTAWQAKLLLYPAPVLAWYYAPCWPCLPAPCPVPEKPA